MRPSAAGLSSGLRHGPLMTLILLLVLFIIGADGSRAQLAQRDVVTEHRGSWSARTNTGLTLAGAWSATPDAMAGTARGTWTLVDAKGREVARGAWSAAKSASGWSGSWRALAAGQTREYSGTWRASLTLKPNAGFAELFEEAARAAVSGSWRAGARSGTWSIKAFSTTSASAQMPVELTALIAKGRLDGATGAWCRAGLRAGQSNAFAVALLAGDGGRYLALEADGRVSELARFSGQPDLSCYTRAEAEALNRSLKQSETIHGQLTPRFGTTVVCGFVDDTTARCWQYSPTDSAFVEVGGWTT